MITYVENDLFKNGTENKNLIGPNRRKMSTLACTGLTRKRTKIFLDLHVIFCSKNLFTNGTEELCVYEKNRKRLPLWDAGESSWFYEKDIIPTEFEKSNQLLKNKSLIVSASLKGIGTVLPTYKSGNEIPTTGRVRRQLANMSLIENLKLTALLEKSGDLFSFEKIRILPSLIGNESKWFYNDIGNSYFAKIRALLPRWTVVESTCFYKNIGNCNIMKIPVLPTVLSKPI